MLTLLLILAPFIAPGPFPGAIPRTDDPPDHATPSASDSAPHSALAPAEKTTIAPAPLSEYHTHEIAGFRVLMHPAIAYLPGDRRGRLRTALAHDLETIARTLPDPALAAVRTIPIAITHDAPTIPGYTPRGACFHPSADWLEAHGLDRAREGAVEMLSIDDYLDWRSIQPAMVLHELAHAYHWLLGFARSDIAESFESVKASGSLYRQVAHTLDPDGPGQTAYALTNPQEYFAELSEAYFLRNDIYPFIREELVAYDPRGADLVRALWNLSPEQIAEQSLAAGHDRFTPTTPSTPAPGLP